MTDDEREACARILDRAAEQYEIDGWQAIADEVRLQAREIRARAIRARSEET